jgi:hypothetical protein
MDKKYLIWSLQHRAWWQEDSWGYTLEYSKAGRFTLEEAEKICWEANFKCSDLKYPSLNEAIVPEFKVYQR